MRKSFLLFMAFLLMSLPVIAQDNSQWSAYLFDNINNALIHVGTTVETQSFSLGIPTGSYIYGMSVSDDGSQVAYCYNHRTDPNADGIMKLIVRDIDQQANLLEQDLGQLAGCSVTAFTSDLVALSMVYIYDFNNMTGKLWELRLIDVLTGETVASLDNENPIMPAVSMFGQPNVPVMADVRELSRETVRFIAIPYVGSEGPAELPAFEWNLAAGTVSELPLPYGYFNADYLPETGEIVFSVLDETLPAAQPFGPMPLANTVKVLDATGEHSIYQNSDFVIASTSFVNNGQSVLVQLFSGFDEQNPDAMDMSIHYVLLNRDGSSVEVAQEFFGAVFTDAIPNGAVFAFTPQLASGGLEPTQILVLGADGTLSHFTDVTIDYSLGWSPPQLVWTSASTVSSDLSPFVGQ
jgi:hypothetical protein